MPRTESNLQHFARRPFLYAHLCLLYLIYAPHSAYAGAGRGAEVHGAEPHRPGAQGDDQRDGRRRLGHSRL